MRHPTEGVLRRLIDEPAGVADADREHVAGCDGCLRELTIAREDADLVHAALAGWPVAEGAGAAAANDWLEIFRTEQIAPISLSTADLNTLPDLRAYGEVAVTAGPDVHPVADAATAEAEATGIDVPEVTILPRGVG